ncbi:gibberellin 2-beta-dioxygenase 8-like isoform X1 [Zingiber officinale]|uniref:gibberellin 2-beta-dioxygenase 8-like isoform X1 n=2 Tax=Zingiber officinale TaxID=94328 RepID=UPI001C4AB5BB|nr:gibberellin 2-beta-dioxygenase 8-like isoform X1 [Zingiber officinale]
MVMETQAAVVHSESTPIPMENSSYPPFLTTHRNLFEGCCEAEVAAAAEEHHYCDLPLIDLGRLHGDELEAERCKRDISAAAADWGFFQIVNHGVPAKLTARLREEQAKLFRQPFKKKSGENLLDFADDSYRWGTPSATCLRQLSWSEAYHIPLFSSSSDKSTPRSSNCKHVIEKYSSAMSELANRLLDTLAEGIGRDSTHIKDNCTRSTCYLRLNRYPPCPVPSQVFGLVPHTDSDFLTILCPDRVTGLQLKKDSKWFTVKPNPNTLIINIGDLFQAWSNGLYKSVEHRVVSNKYQERFSVAYFVCPSKETMIQSNVEPAKYRKFSFGEYRQQVQQDVSLTGYKVGLARYLA